MLSPQEEQYLQQLECTILHASSTGSQESSHQLDIQRCQQTDGLAGPCLELLRRRGWGREESAAIDIANTTAAIAIAQQQNGGSIAQQQMYDAVSFYALTTLQRSPILSCCCTIVNNSNPVQHPQQQQSFATLRNQLRTILLSTISNPTNLQLMPSFIITKIAVLLALLVREEYPNYGWGSPLKDVLVALHLVGNSMQIIDDNVMSSMAMYISFLDAISDEIVYPSYAEDDNNSNSSKQHYAQQRIRREEVKDALRGHAIAPTNGNNNVSSNSNTAQQAIPLEHTDTANIVGWLLDVVNTITTHASSSSLSITQDDNKNRKLSIAVRALATLKRYLSWIDLRLVTNPTLIQLLLDGLGRASPSTTTSPASTLADKEEEDEEPTQCTILAVECAYCLCEIINRGMEDEKKVVLLTELRIFDTLCRLSQIDASDTGSSTTSNNGGSSVKKLDLINDSNGGTQIEAVAAAAELINIAGLALIQGWELDPTSCQSTIIQMKQCLELTLACLAYDSIDVSGAVVDVTSRILVSLEKKEDNWVTIFGDTSICNTILSRILIILQRRMKYPHNFQYDYENEEEAEEEVYRTSLRKLYQRIVRLRPQITLQFIGQLLNNLPTPLSSSSTPDIEVALRFVYHYGEGRRPAPGAKTALKDGPFREMIMAIHRSDVAAHPHREVLLLYYDLSVRYVGILKESSDLLTLLLASFCGSRGLQHHHTRVRCRCCYLLLRLIKSVGSKDIRPHVENIVDGIQRLLFPPVAPQPEATIPPNEALYLFESTGILLGTTGLDDEVQVNLCKAVLTPHIQSIERTLGNPDLGRDVEANGEQLAMSISAIAQLSKGWQKHPPPGVQTILAAAVDVCHNVLLSLPSSAVVRNRTAVLLQRMILCLGEQILPAMPGFFSPLLLHCTLEDDVLDVSQLMNQICIKFKGNAAVALDSALLPFLKKVMTIQIGDGDANSGYASGGISPPPHLIIEQLSVRKQAFATLQHIAVHNVSSVLYSETNVASLGDILQLMNDGAITVPDPVMKKVCVQFFCELIDQFGCCGGTMQGQTPTLVAQHVSTAFFDFVYSVFVPGMLRCVLDSTFNFKDALYRRVLLEYCRALWLLKQTSLGGNEDIFQSRVIETLVLGEAAMKVEERVEIANGFRNAGCGKDMELALKVWKEKLQ